MDLEHPAEGLFFCFLRTGQNTGWGVYPKHAGSEVVFNHICRLLLPSHGGLAVLNRC